MAKLKLRTTILSKLSTLTRSEGNLVITRDGETLYFDTDTKRFKISDFIDVADDNDRLAILAPNTEKMYYVLSTNAVWRYISGTWYEVTSTEDVSDIISSLSNKADSNKAYLTDDSTSTDIADGDYIPLSSANAKKKSTFSNFVAKIKAKLITDTYSGTSTTGMSGKAVKSAIDALDGTVTGSPSASKTLTAFSQTDGKVSATFGDINISKSQINDFPTIPTVNNATLTIQKNGTNVQTFTANASSNKTANITVPVTQADLTEVRLTNEDLDDVTYPGFYYAGGGNTVTNKPTGYNNFGLVVVHNAAQSQYTQVISNENGSYRRIKKADGTWISWAEDKFTDTTYSFADGTNQFTVTPSGSTASTIKVTPQLKIDGITSDTTDKEINCYGECSTAASTAAKTVSITKGTFALGVGAKVIVKFTNANTANNPTLNVNSKGAKNIFHNGARITTGANKALLAGTVEFVYDGTQFQLVGNYIDTDTTYTFAGGTDKFTVTPSGGSAQTVNVANGGVRSVATGSTFGTLSVNTGGTTADKALNLTGEFQDAGQDLNNFKTSGFYYFSSGNAPTNVPAGSNGILVVIAGHISATTGMFVKQIWMRHGTNDLSDNTKAAYYSSNDQETYVRTYNNSTWSSWHKVFASTVNGNNYRANLQVSKNDGRNGQRTWTNLYVGNSTGIGTADLYVHDTDATKNRNGSQCGRIYMYNGTTTGTSNYATVLTPAANTGERTITFPNDSGTVALTKNINVVAQTDSSMSSSYNKYYRVLFSNSDNDTTENAGTRKCSQVLINPYDGSLRAGFLEIAPDVDNAILSMSNVNFAKANIKVPTTPTADYDIYLPPVGGMLALASSWTCENSSGHTGTTAFTTNILDTVSEIFLKVQLGEASNKIFIPIHIPVATISATNDSVERWRGGYYQSSTAGGEVSYWIWKKDGYIKMHLDIAYLNGSSVASSTKVYVYYKTY